MPLSPAPIPSVPSHFSSGKDSSVHDDPSHHYNKHFVIADETQSLMTLTVVASYKKDLGDVL